MDEPKFIVFYTMRMTLFSKFCFKCKSDLPSVSMKVYGTLTTVYQECNICGNGYKWHSQPLVLGRYPAGDGRQSWGASPQFLEWRDEYPIIPPNFLTCLMKFCFLVT
jgi:hypothetical protein